MKDHSPKASEENINEITDLSFFEPEFFESTPITTKHTGEMEENAQYVVTSAFFKEKKADISDVKRKHPMIKLKKCDQKKHFKAIEKRFEKKLEEKLQEFNKKIAILEHKNTNLEKEISILHKKVAILQNSNTNLQKKVTILTKKCSTFEDMNNLLENKIENRVQKFTLENDVLKSNIAMINEHNAVICKRNELQELEIANLNKQNEILASNVETLTQNCRQSNASINDLEERISICDLKSSFITGYMYEHPEHLA